MSGLHGTECDCDPVCDRCRADRHDECRRETAQALALRAERDRIDAMPDEEPSIWQRLFANRPLTLTSFIDILKDIYTLQEYGLTYREKLQLKERRIYEEHREIVTGKKARTRAEIAKAWGYAVDPSSGLFSLLARPSPFFGAVPKSSFGEGWDRTFGPKGGGR